MVCGIIGKLNSLVTVMRLDTTDSFCEFLIKSRMKIFSKVLIPLFYYDIKN